MPCAADRRGQPVADHHEQGVAGVVPVLVVDGLEVVHVEQGDVERGAGGEQLADVGLQQRAVGDAGEVVVGGLVGQLVLVRAELGEVGVDHAEQQPVLAQRDDLPRHHQQGEATALAFTIVDSVRSALSVSSSRAAMAATAM